MNKSVSVLMVGGGVVLLYLAYTGYLSSAWNGIRGQCDCAKPAATGTGTKPATAGEVPGPSRQYLNRGSYNVSATGGIRVSDAGQW